MKKKKHLTQEEMKDAIKNRPSNFETLTANEQWEVDKELGCLDYCPDLD